MTKYSENVLIIFEYDDQISTDALRLPNGTTNGSSAIATVSTDQPDANSAEVTKEIEDTIYSRVNSGSPNGDSNNNHDLKVTSNISSLILGTYKILYSILYLTHINRFTDDFFLICRLIVSSQK